MNFMSEIYVLMFCFNITMLIISVLFLPYLTKDDMTFANTSAIVFVSAIPGIQIIVAIVFTVCLVLSTIDFVFNGKTC